LTMDKKLCKTVLSGEIPAILIYNTFRGI